jgi:hypothetical protein
LWVAKIGIGINDINFSPQVIIPSEYWEENDIYLEDSAGNIAQEESQIQVYTKVNLEISGTATPVPVTLSNSYQTITFKKDCATEDLSLISDTILTDTDSTLVRKQGQAFSLTWDDT